MLRFEMNSFFVWQTTNRSGSNFVMLALFQDLTPIVCGVRVEESFPTRSWEPRRGTALHAAACSAWGDPLRTSEAPPGACHFPRSRLAERQTQPGPHLPP